MNRQSLLDKIRALFSKTVANGCTEQEAMAAIDKARAMMDSYEVSEADLQLTRDERATLREAADADDKHQVRFNLLTGVSRFCEVKGFRRNASGKIAFIGQPADIDLAFWLLDSLESFVRQSLVEFLIGCGLPKGQRRHAITCFTKACCARISSRLREARPNSAQAADAAARGTALVLVKKQQIDDYVRDQGFHFRKSRSNTRLRDGNAYNAGLAAGDRASFHRPMGSAARAMITG